MKRFRVLEFSFLTDSELEGKLNNEVSKSEKIIHFTIEKDPNQFSLGKRNVRVVLENIL